MTDERIAKGLLLQARRRRLTTNESQWLCNYGNSHPSGNAPRPKSSSLFGVWLFLCVFIGSGIVYMSLTLGSDKWLEISYWTKLLSS